MNRPTMNNGAIIKLFNNSGGQRFYVRGGQRHSRNASFQLQTHENVFLPDFEKKFTYKNSDKMR